MRPIGAFNAALGGLNRQLQGFDRAAAQVVERSVGAEGFEPIDISSGVAVEPEEDGDLEVPRLNDHHELDLRPWVESW